MQRFFSFFSRSNEKLGQRKSYDAAIGEYPLLFTAAAATIVNGESQQSDRARNFPVVSNTFRGNERGGNERETRKIFVPNLVPPFLVARLFLFNEQLHRRERGEREREVNFPRELLIFIPLIRLKGQFFPSSRQIRLSLSLSRSFLFLRREEKLERWSIDPRSANNDNNASKQNSNFSKNTLDSFRGGGGNVEQRGGTLLEEIVCREACFIITMKLFPFSSPLFYIIHFFK